MLAGSSSWCGDLASDRIGSAKSRCMRLVSRSDMRKSFNTPVGAGRGAWARCAQRALLSFRESQSKAGKGAVFSTALGSVCSPKRLDKGPLRGDPRASQAGRAADDTAELQLFIEGSEAVGRVELSPPLLTLSDLTPRWHEKKPLS